MSDTTFVHCSLADANPGGTRSNFSITFEQSLHFPAGTRVRVNDVRLINSFPTITTDNNYLFVQQGTVLHAIQLLTGYFNALDLVKMLGAALNPRAISVSYNTNQNNITFSALTPFTIMTDDQLAQFAGPWPIPTSDPLHPKSVNGLLRNLVDGPPATTYVVPCVLVNPHDTIYLRCRHLSSSHIYTAFAAHDVLCVINVDQSYGQLLTAQTPNLDSIKMGSAFSHKTMEFYITDRAGNPVDLQAGVLTFTLAFYH